MKSLQKLRSMAIVGCVTIFAVSCSQDDAAAISYDKSDLVGPWMISSAEIEPVGIPAGDSLATYPEGSILTFFGNDTYSFSVERTGVPYERGEWAIEENEVVMINTVSQVSKPYVVKVLNRQEVTLQYQQPGDSSDASARYQETLVFRSVK